MINPKYSSSSSISLSKNGTDLSSSEAAEEFNSVFCSVFTNESPLPATLTLQSLDSAMDDLLITQEGIAAAIDRLPTNSAPGPDEICTKLLKMTKVVISPILAALFQQSIDTGCVPFAWRIARVIPIFKSGDPSVPLNYRPISLTSIVCKLLEHIISSAVMSYLTKESFFFSNQHGFLRGRSCETQLFELMTDLHNAVHSSSQIDAIFIDFAKAFDKVPHIRLMEKLSALNINPKINRWIKNFLTHRFQSVTINDHSSSLAQVTSGVPQGSVLGPILFLIYINDINTNISSTIRLFADDCVIYKQIKNPQDFLSLQADLNQLTKWCRDWQMEVNVPKTNAITFTKTSASEPRHYFLNSMPVQTVTMVKYLGVHITSDLTWNHHIDTITSKASKSLGFIRRNLHSANTSTKLLAYQTLVRSKIEYAALIWNPHQSYLVNKLEALQNKAARFILRNYSRTSSITEMKQSLNLPPLQQRRLYSLLSVFHRLYHG